MSGKTANVMRAPIEFPSRKRDLWGLLNSFAIRALKRKYALPVLLALYEAGVLRTTDLIRGVRGHPATVIGTVRALEGSRIVSRTRPLRDRRAIEIRLTAQGLGLLETAMSRWKPLIRNWDRVR